MTLSADGASMIARSRAHDSVDTANRVAQAPSTAREITMRWMSLAPS